MIDSLVIENTLRCLPGIPVNRLRHSTYLKIIESLVLFSSKITTAVLMLLNVRIRQNIYLCKVLIL